MLLGLQQMVEHKFTGLCAHECCFGLQRVAADNWLRGGRIPEPERNPMTKYRRWTVKDVELIRNLMAAGEPE